MATILITDAEGLIGDFTIRELLPMISSQNTGRSTEPARPVGIIRAGYHSQQQLQTAVRDNISSHIINPVLVDWKKPQTYSDVLQGVNVILLLTPFTSAKVEQCQAWMDAAKQEVARRSQEDHTCLHIVHVGVHCNDKDENDRVPHETWQLQAEEVIRSTAAANPKISWTFLRLNFDGYNGVLKPGEISYFLPQSERYGWMAREDIATAAARILIESQKHSGNIYPLITEALSLDDMAITATNVCGFRVIARGLPTTDFEKLALSPQANPDNDEGYIIYMESVCKLFEGLAIGMYPYHTQQFPEIFYRICGRDPLSFEQWLVQSPFRRKLSIH